MAVRTGSLVPGGGEDRAPSLTCCCLSFMMDWYWKWGSWVSRVASWARAQPVPNFCSRNFLLKHVSLEL